MKKLVYSLSMLVCCVAASAQINEKSINSDPFYAAGPFHTYTYTAQKDTPAPKGYKPFYISHVGRHGSRCLADSDPSYAPVVEKMEQCLERKLLTRKGEKLLEDMKVLAKMQDANLAQITEIGAREHREIAARMYKRFRPVWTNRSRREVHCKSTTVQRCILSMTNSTNELKGLNPKLDFSYEAGIEVARNIRPDTSLFHPVNKPVKIRTRAHFHRVFNPDEFYSRVFFNPEAAKAVTGDPKFFCLGVYDLWKDAQCAGMDKFDARDYFSAAELCDLLCLTADRWYEVFSSFADPASPACGIVNGLLSDILNGAQEALDDGKVCAHLRYTHDSALMPLFFKLGLENYPLGLSREKARELWSPTEIMPMATNIQIVFYSKKECEPLVKLLFNERETRLVGLEPVQGPYYKWSDVSSLIKKGIK